MTTSKSKLQLILPWALTFAVDAMLYVFGHEIVPETHIHGYKNGARTGLTVEMLAMMLLDIGFGCAA